MPPTGRRYCDRSPAPSTCVLAVEYSATQIRCGTKGFPMRKITWAGGGVAGEASHLSVQAFSSSEIMTAMQNGSGNLELIGWLVDGDKVTRANNGTATAGTVQEVALALVGRRAVTAVRSGSNNLLLISWNVPFGVTSIDRLLDSEKQAGEASQIAMAAI